MREYNLFTSESVSEGHPDKMADQISDAILDAILQQDLDARVACETLVKTGAVILAGRTRCRRSYVGLTQIPASARCRSNPKQIEVLDI